MRVILLSFVLFATIAERPEPRPAARTIVIHGTVREESGNPLPRANVFINSANVSVGTDARGAYSLSVRVADTTRSLLVGARAIGYAPTTVTTPITRDSVRIDFTLKQELTQLSEVVATGAPVFTVGRGGHGDGGWNTEEYSKIEDNRFLSVASSPLSTFSVDVDRASYTNVRRFINEGTLPPKDAVRIEELINYFAYDYPVPGGRHPISITTDVAAAPWNPTHRIVRIGLQTRPIPTEALPPSNLVFLIDVSGSMTPANKLPLARRAFRLLVNELREQDRVSIVVYAGNAGLVLPSTSGLEKERILGAIEGLEAGGSTAGGEGIRLAYAVAHENFIPRGNNRVILATDGDFNVGISSTSELVRFVERRREEGIALTVLGFGMGNLKDGRLEQLADKGNGNYAYIDNLLEARKIFVQEMGATLHTVAKDVKLQVEFNPAAVQAYRLIGYENRLLRNEDFADDKTDAGDMGAGHSVTALYEIIPAGVRLDVEVGTNSTLRYQTQQTRRARASSRELLFVNVRYKAPTESRSRLMQQPVIDAEAGVRGDFLFALAVAGYGMLLRDSDYKGALTYDDVLALAKDGTGGDRYRADFVSLVEATKRIAGRVARDSRGTGETPWTSGRR